MKQLLAMNQGLRSVNNVVIKRGDILYADLSPVIGSEQGGVRPVLIIQNDIGNKYSPTVIVAAITSQINKAKLPTHVEINAEEYGITEKVGHLSDELMKKVDDGLQISFGLIEYSV
ncbi:MAG: transcriptional modulator of MazE/toxin, MazF [Clostridia bacterium]|nr:transcriptional modulator of MazE/toxin, MazF [Clostridia bacterium]